MKYLNLLCLIVCLVMTTTTCNSQQSTSKRMQDQSTITFQNRPAVVAGTFYPGNRVDLNDALAQFFTVVLPDKKNRNVQAIICPHAGYVYSGLVAAAAYNQLDFSKNYERVFVIGSSHRVAFNGASIYNLGNYETPLGEVEIDKKLCDELIEENEIFTFYNQAHEAEHSLEVQLPFLQYIYKENLKIVPIIIGSQNKADSKKIADALTPFFNENSLFVISSDFSHYPNYEDATNSDNETWLAIQKGDPDVFYSYIQKDSYKKGLVTKACGWTSILTLLYLTNGNSDLEFVHIDYKNSGDSNYGDQSRVVGYQAIMVTEKSNKLLNEKVKKQTMEDNGNEFYLTKNDKELLVEIARATLKTYLQDKQLIEYDDSKFSKSMIAKCGAFVTLHNDKQLRGCIGRFVSDEPLYKVVQQMAISAATQDHRFAQVTLPELKEIDIEISVLTPLKRIRSIDEFELGKQGIYIIQGYNRGTFLPQVADETGWTKEEFLGHCARDKARIGWDGWKTAELYTYEANVFDEKGLGFK